MMPYAKPLPIITLLNKPFWDAVKQHELRMQKCKDCGQIIWPISVHCQNCWSERYEWARLSGKGKLSSWVVHHHIYHPAFADDIPYAVAEVQLDEGPRLMTNIVGTDASHFSHLMPVEVYFDDVTPEVTLVKFRRLP